MWFWSWVCFAQMGGVDPLIVVPINAICTEIATLTPCHIDNGEGEQIKVLVISNAQ